MQHEERLGGRLKQQKCKRQRISVISKPSIKVSKHKDSPAIKSKDVVLLTEPAQALDRWSEHSHDVLNLDSKFDMSVLKRYSSM